MGNPLVLLDHEENYRAEATLLAHAGWRCVDYDLVASVFVPRERRELEAFPLSPDEPWDPARGILLAQSTFCYERALKLNPHELGALISLHDAFKSR
jgi:hypothetical protein